MEDISFFGVFLSPEEPVTFVRVNIIIKKEDYCEMLDGNLEVPVKNLKLMRAWSFFSNNDPKHF